MPAIPGTTTSSCSCSPEKTAPNMASSSSGSRKPKKAAVGLRQNIRRSSRYWRQAATPHGGRRAGMCGRRHGLERVVAHSVSSR